MVATGRRNLHILAFTLVVVMLGYGMIIPILPFYIENLGAGGTELGLLVATYAVMRLIFGPLWGSLSDRLGRKPVLMVGVFGYGVTMILFGLATQLWMLFLFRALSGILSSATAPTTMAYVSDSTSGEERGAGMGFLGAALGIGTIIGPALGGLLAGDSLSTPFFIAGGLSFLALILIWIVLPESLPARSSEPHEARKPHSRRDTWQALTGPLAILLGMAFLVSYGTNIFFGVFGLYTLHKFDAGPEQVGLILMVVGVVAALAQGVLTGPLTRRWGEANLIKTMLPATGLGFLAIALTRTFLPFLLAVGGFTLATTLLSPAVMALTSRRTSLEQGITMGLSNSFISLGRIVGPALGGFLFDVNLEYPNLCGGIGMLAGAVLALVWVKDSSPSRENSAHLPGAVT
jgi:DHA1 family multidrug resistance protein-like MFS transporter